MRLSTPLLSAVFVVATTVAGLAQATLPNDDVNVANNPGTVKVAPPVRVEALDCTCRDPAPGPAVPDGTAAPGDRIIDCRCHEAVPGTTGTLTVPLTGSAGDTAAPSR